MIRHLMVGCRLAEKWLVVYVADCLVGSSHHAGRVLTTSSQIHDTKGRPVVRRTLISKTEEIQLLGELFPFQVVVRSSSRNTRCAHLRTCVFAALGVMYYAHSLRLFCLPWHNETAYEPVREPYMCMRSSRLL